MILLINPQSAEWKFRLPLSVLAVAGSVQGKYEVCVLDENFDRPVAARAEALIRERGIRYVGLTVMPGPQLTHAVPLTRHLRTRFPELTIIWGGYFASQHTDTVLQSGLVDMVVRGQADHAFPQLIDALESGAPLDGIENLSWIRNGTIVHNPSAGIIDPNTCPPLPLQLVDVPRYIGKSYLGERTTVSHSSVGCPFLCGFCAVAGVYQGRWMGLDADALADDILAQQARWNIDAVLFYDNNFFVSEKRTARFAERMIGKHIAWWGEARPDTVMQFSDTTLRLMRDGGCKMMFFGAESGSQETLDAMDKGGTQTPDTVLQLCERLKTFDIIPELSFVLGNPSDTIDRDIERDIRFIRECKRINPRAEIVIYIYSPVVFDDAPMFRDAEKRGFAFPKTLDEWVSPRWATFDQRKNPMTPWLLPRHVDRIKNFEAVIDAAFPTATDHRLTAWQRAMLKALGTWRYAAQFYAFPYEIKLAKKLMRYLQPQQEGF